MGWTFSKSWRDAEAVKREVTSTKHWGPGYQVLESAWGYEGPDPYDGERTLFLAMQRTDQAKEGAGEQFIAVYLVGPQRGYGYGYKDMDESMGPYRNDCPLEILDLVTAKPSRYANAEWRAKARAKAGGPQLALI